MPEGTCHQRPTTMHQRSFASVEFASKKKRTGREVFLAEMERVGQGEPGVLSRSFAVKSGHT